MSYFIYGISYQKYYQEMNGVKDVEKIFKLSQIFASFLVIEIKKNESRESLEFIFDSTKQEIRC